MLILMLHQLQHLQELLEQLIAQQLQLTQQVEKLLKQLYPKIGQKEIQEEQTLKNIRLKDLILMETKN